MDKPRTRGSKQPPREDDPYHQLFIEASSKGLDGFAAIRLAEQLTLGVKATTAAILVRKLMGIDQVQQVHVVGGRLKRTQEMNEGTKLCTRCGIEKHKLEFNRDRYSKDGLTVHCSDCCREKQRAWKAGQPGYVTCVSDGCDAVITERFAARGGGLCRRCKAQVMDDSAAS